MRYKRWLSIGILILHLSCSVVVYANDGSLQINSDIRQYQDKEEVFYIEQEQELAILFTPRLTDNIERARDTHQQQETNFRHELFLTDLEKVDVLSDYRSLLFSQTGLTSNDGSYHINYTQKSSTLTLPILLIVMVSFLITVLSLVRIVKRVGRT